MAELSVTTQDNSTSGRRIYRDNSKGNTDVSIKKSKSDILWQQYYAELKLFYQKNGHIQVPITYLTANGRKLNSWIAHQRKHRKDGKLSDEQIALLDELGMVWGHHDQLAWDNLLTHLRQYINENGTTNIPSTYVCEDGYKLGACLGWYKNKYNKGELPEKNIAELDELGVSLDPKESVWDKYYARAKEYFEEHGVTYLPVNYCDEEGNNLYAWLMRQKKLYEKGELPTNRMRDLEDLGYPFTPTVTKRQVREQKIWLEKYEFVRAYCKEHPGETIGSDVMFNGGNIRDWLYNQVGLIKRKKIDPERYAMLQELNIPNFIFDEAAINARESSEKEVKRNLRLENWNVRFDEIKAFVDKNGRLPMFVDSERNMCIWVKRQRIRCTKGNLTDGQAEKLRSIGVELSNVESSEDKWLKNYEKLKMFISENGRMPKQTKKNLDEKVLSNGC